MKVKLIEAATPIKKLDQDIKSVIIPAFKKQGFNIDPSRTISPTKYAYDLKGRYTYNDSSIPFWLTINTTSPVIGEYNDPEGFTNKDEYKQAKRNNELANVFMEMRIEDQIIKLGACNSSNYNQVSDLIDKSFPDLNKVINKIEIPDEEKEPEKSQEEIEQDEDVKALQGTKASILTQKKDEEVQELKAEKKEEPKQPSVNTDEIGKKIAELASNYGVTMTYETATIGPAITQYEFKLAPGTKISELAGLSKEIAMGLAVKDVSIAPVQGKTTVGVQVPNAEISIVTLDEVLEKSEKKGLSVAIGKDLNGNAVNADILDMQHVLIGGSTGSGKSASINSMITSLIQSYPPDMVKLILIDPKKVELSAYANVPHLAQQIITNPADADKALSQVCTLMDKRYDTFEKVGVKNIKAYNNLVDSHNETSEKKIAYMPYIVIVIDELADLMMTAGKSVEHSIKRITQLARAAGIHMIVATQRPSADVVTGDIKNNIQSRIAFATPSNVDSRVILDQSGAEKLLGKGDMLFKPTGESSPKRLQGTFVSDDEINNIVNKVIDKYK